MNKFGTMFSDVSVSLFRRPATQRYPFVRTETPARLRGRLEWKQGPCTGCGLCAMDCPAKAIEVTMIDRKEKKFFLTYHVDACTFCGQCVISCRQGALQMAEGQWELASLDPAQFKIYFGDPNVGRNLASQPDGQPAEPEKT
ncbi:MAG TPA: 4Fe-4S binding protein [Anaerolineales bacterium]|nr:4Fe-4S binding protein [Anaerolineales bacterium]